MIASFPAVAWRDRLALVMECGMDFLDALRVVVGADCVQTGDAISAG
ncbi:MAG: hypothetical protein H7251_17515 [Acetobacteraceae bacterium]|nr:hypothetical protein [Acetobacteraceae bacterium]